MFSTTFNLWAMVTLIVAAIAQSDTMTSTVSITTSSSARPNAPTEILVPIGSSSTGLAASIVSADPCKTTVVLECTETGSMPCGHPGLVTFTVVEGQGTYDYHFDLTSKDFSIIMSQTCKFQGWIASVTQAECSSSISTSMSSSTATFTTTATVTEFLPLATVPVTAAADKLPPASLSCSAATTGSSSQVASPTTTSTGGSSHSKESVAGMLAVALIGAAIGYRL